MGSTTIRLTNETVDRIRALGGGDDEQTIVEALDALETARLEAAETARFWAQADAAAAWRASLTDGERARIAAEEARNARLLDGID